MSPSSIVQISGRFFYIASASQANNYARVCVNQNTVAGTPGSNIVQANSDSGCDKEWFIDCTTAGCKMKQNNDTKLSMSVSDAVNGENVIADDQDFDWNVLNSDSVLGAYQFSVPNSDPSLLVTLNDSSGNLFLAVKSDSKCELQSWTWNI